MASEMAAINEPNVQLGFSTEKGIKLLWNYGKIFAESTIVPDTFKGNQGNCMIALNMAIRMNADPLMVMQNLYLVYGRPSWSSQFLISTFNCCGRFTAIRYEWSGKPGTDDYGCRASAVEKATGEKLEGSLVNISMAKKEGWYDKKGSKWQTMQQQMLMYRAASWFIRAYAPEIAMGLHTQEEVIDTIELGEDEYKLKTEISKKANQKEINITDTTPKEATETVKVETSKELAASTNENLKPEPDSLLTITDEIPSMF